MPRSIAEGFKDFLTKLTASGAESDAAKAHRASIEACLKRNFGLNRFTRIGSFGNGTNISGYSDVDYLACFPRDVLTNSSTYSLSKVRDALDTRFPNTGVHVDCPAVVVPFGTKRVEITEIVPADYMRDEHGIKVYDIPDCANGWMKASPDLHNGYVQYVDNKHDGMVKPLIRFVKAWKYFRSVPISSFYLELRVAKYAADEPGIIYDMDVARVLRRLLNAELANMQDPMGISGYIAPCKTEAMRQDALSKLATAVTRAEKARAVTDAGRISEAFDWWRLLYDDQFPTYNY